MRMTLLDIVQDILSDMDSDEVNSIDDTVESQQVAQIVKSAFFAMMSNRNWSHLRRAISLYPSGNVTRPTHMKVKENFKELCFINYDVAKITDDRKLYREMKWLEPDKFLFLLNNRNTSDTNVLTVKDHSGIDLFIIKDKAPQYYTSFNDVELVFDSFDEQVGATLQEGKLQAVAYVIPSWLHQDDYVPDLPAEAFTALLEESKSRAMLRLKQVQDIKAEQEANKQQRWLSRKNWTVNGGIRYPNYGRKGNK